LEFSVFLNFLGHLNSWGSIFNWGSFNSLDSSNWGNSWDKTSESSNDWGMVDNMLGGVGGDMLLNLNLWNMLDCVVNLVTNLVNNWGSGNSNWSSSISSNWSSMDNWGSSIGGSWNSISGNSWGLNLDSLDLWNLNLGDNWSSVLNNWGSLDNWGSILNNWGNLTNWINKSILVQVLGETLQRQGSEAIWSSNKITNSLSEWSRGSTLVDVWLGSNNNLWISSWGSQRGTNREESNKEFHVD